MSFMETLRQWRRNDMAAHLAGVSADDVLAVLAKARLTPLDFLTLLSPAASAHLEAMAQRAHDSTLRHFGRTIQLYTPLYLANHCTNQCVYCGFSARNRIARSQLTLEQVVAEGRAIAATGLRHLLLLTGDAPRVSTVDYIAAAANALRPLFPSLSVEVYAMETAEYATLHRNGVDGLTIYQETYNEALYSDLHPAGPKRDFLFRLDAPERGGDAGLRSLGVGALLGLDLWQHDAFYTGLHAAWLHQRHPSAEISVSVPRMRPHAGAYQPASIVSDRDLVQIMLAFRLFLPMAGITVSTREAATLRNHLIPLGVTRMSAGVSTAVGGRTRHEDDNVGQFDISDPRTVDEVAHAIRQRGYQPVLKDWEPPVDNVYGCGDPARVVGGGAAERADGAGHTLHAGA